MWRKQRYMFRKRNRRTGLLWLVISILVVAIGLIWFMPWLTFSSMNIETPKVDASKDQPEQGALKDRPKDEIALENSPPPMEEEVSNNQPPPPVQAPAPPVQASAPPAQTPSLPSTSPPSPPRVEEVPKNFSPSNGYQDYGASYWYYEPDYYWYYEPDYYWDY